MVPKLTDDITDFEIRREERRSVFLLGMLAIVVAARINAHGTDTVQIVGLNWPLIPLLDILIGGWFGYAMCMLVFLSDDFFDWRVGKWGRWKIGNVVRRVALIGAHGLAFVPGLFLLWIILSLGAVLSLPAPFFAMGILLPIWVLVAMLFVAVFRFVRKLIERKLGEGTGI